MATQKYDSFKDLRKGKYDWKVQARVMNLWRGYTKKGEPFKAFNLLLLDSKRCRIHAFVPGHVADLLEPSIEAGNIYLFKNFTVKEYKEEEKFRCILKDIQIIFSNETKISRLEENEVCIDKAGFDFYDLADLKELSTQTTYLTDVIGVIQDHDELRLARFNNRLGQPQTQIKFTITDGKTNVNVTFWDQLAEHFDEAIREEDFETPLIIIIGCGRVTKWKEEVDVSNVGATSFYINYNHHCVSLLRAMYDSDFLNIPLPKRYNLCIRATDDTAEINIVLENVAGQKCYGKHAYEMLDKIDENVFPEGLKTIEGKEYTMKLAKKGNSYVAKDVSHVIDFENFTTENEDAQPRPIQESYGEIWVNCNLSSGVYVRK
ncbi:hypothetical protein POM88_001890 [Heracleum sosnowskyi]|uniref:Replication protein A 70 kDa DNA-binding subunit B/D first OB fold domain-containing protein n=1 Tax=Heracleum sosnowskyi TaxID=360622 RepID=A0AAD8N5F8_9APIA|nr:hypothetical protein POM88_001890 [Heracleum sosnowskyi]